MVAHAPTIEAAEIRGILSEVSPRGENIPQPERVEVVASEDPDGEPVWVMRVVFPASISAQSLPWSKVSPLVQRLRRLVYEKGGEDRFVLAEVRRLSEDQPGAR